MSREQMLLRAGVYFGLAERLLADDSYFLRWLGRADELTEADYSRETAEIQARLVAAGKIAPDEDPFETMR